MTIHWTTHLNKFHILIGFHKTKKRDGMGHLIRKWLKEWSDAKFWQKKRMNVEKWNGDGCFETPTMNGKRGLNEICPWRQNLGEFWRIGPASLTTWPSDHPRRIQQIVLHFCKPTSGGVVNSLGLAQSVDWSILFVQLYEQTIQGLYNALSLSSVDALSPDPRVDVLQCLQKRHSPCHEMDWVGFYWASYLLSSSW